MTVGGWALVAAIALIAGIAARRRVRRTLGRGGTEIDDRMVRSIEEEGEVEAEDPEAPLDLAAIEEEERRFWEEERSWLGEERWEESEGR